MSFPPRLAELAFRIVLSENIHTSDPRYRNYDNFFEAAQRLAEQAFQQSMNQTRNLGSVCDQILENPRRYTKRDMLNCIEKLTRKMMELSPKNLPPTMFGPVDVGEDSGFPGYEHTAPIFNIYTYEYLAGLDNDEISMLSQLPEFALLQPHPENAPKQRNLLRTAYLDAYMTFLKHMPKSFLVKVIHGILTTRSRRGALHTHIWGQN